MKIFFTCCLFFIVHSLAYSQVTDSLPLTDTSAFEPVSATQDSVVKAYARADSLARQSRTADSLKKVAEKNDTSTHKRHHTPRGATIRSAIIPGWGQVYNRKYWKLPLVYGAIGFPAFLIVNNKKWYDRARYALSIVANNRYAGPAAADSLSRVHPQLLVLVNQKAQGSLINFRNESRKNMDYSVLFTALMWGLNVVDATVDGHLKAFNVSDDLSLKIRPTFIPGPNVPGVSLVVNFRR